jgi:hypothetical protein
LTLVDMGQVRLDGEHGSDDVSVHLERSVAEAAVSTPGTFLIHISDCHLVRRDDHMQFRTSGLRIQAVDVTEHDVRR